MFNGPWLISDHYLNVQRWVPNFVTKTAAINSLPVWVRFLVLPIKYYIKRWLVRAGDRVDKLFKLDDMTLLASRGKFALVCLVINLMKPLKVGYWLRGRRCEVKYEGLHDSCIHHGNYDHRLCICPEKHPQKQNEGMKDRKN